MNGVDFWKMYPMPIPIGDLRENARFLWDWAHRDFGRERHEYAQDRRDAKEGEVFSPWIDLGGES